MKKKEQDWKTMALECRNALSLMEAHYSDLGKNNPGFMGELCLQRYDLWNEALLAMDAALKKYAKVPS